MLKQEYILFFLLITLFHFSSNAQQSIIEMTHYGMDEGLSHREAHVIFEDSEGFMWIGTKYGLNRFDGEEFKWYNQNKKGFSFNHISKITEDDEGWLWLWNDKDFIFFHPKSGETQTLEERFGNDVPLKKNINTNGSWKYWSTRFVPQDQKNRLFIPSSQKDSYLSYLSEEGFKLHHYPGLDSFDLKHISTDGHFLFNNKNIFLELDSNFNLILKENKGEINFIKNISNLDEKVHTIIHQKGLANKNNQGFLFNGKDIFVEYFYQIKLNSKTKTMWLYNHKEWLVFDLKMNLIASINFDELSESFQNYHFVDSKGRLWVTSDQGVTLLELVNHPFSFYFNQGNNFPLNSSARGIWSDGMNIYTNLEKGGFFKSDMEGNWTLLDQSLENVGEQTVPQNIDYWGRALIKDKDGLFWIGGKRNLRSYNPETEETIYFYTPEYKDIHNENEYLIDIWAIHEGHNGTLWLGTGSGLSYKEPNSDFIFDFQTSTTNFDFSQSIILHIHEENDSILYLSTNRGLYIFNTLKKEVLERFWLGGDKTHFLPESDIQHIHKDVDGSYWLSSVNGLIHWKKETNEYEVFNRKDGLPDNNVYGVLEDKHSNLWAGTDRGLVRFNKKNKTVQVYSTNDGLPFLEFNRISYHQSQNGKMFFGGMNGIIQFSPDQFLLNNEFINKDGYKMQISEILIFNEKNNRFIDITKQYWRDGKLIMNRNSSFFNINFTMLSYGKDQNNRYQYKIDGINKSWIDIEKSNIQLNRLPYGTYQLNIKGFYNGTSENEQDLNITIVVPPPFYYTWWFILSTIIAIAVIILYFFWRRDIIVQKRQQQLENEIQKANQELLHKYQLISEQKEELQKANYTKNHIFAILGHDLRKPANAFRGIAKRVNYLIKKKDFYTLEQVSQSIERDALGLNSLTDNLLNWALTERDTLPHQEVIIDLKVIIDEVILTLDRLAKDKSVHLVSNVKEETFVFADKNSLLIIIRNLVDNAIKFTPKNGKIELKTKVSKSNTQLIILDNGIGIHPDKIKMLFSLENGKTTKGTEGEKGTGIGLHLVHELVKRNNGKINVESQLNKGTTFYILLANKLVT